MITGDGYKCDGCHLDQQFLPMGWFTVVFRAKAKPGEEKRRHFCTDLCFDRYLKNGLPMGTTGEVVDSERVTA